MNLTTQVRSTIVVALLGAVPLQPEAYPSCKNTLPEAPATLDIIAGATSSHLSGDGKGSFHTDRTQCLRVSNNSWGEFSLNAGGNTWSECATNMGLIRNERFLLVDLSHPLPPALGGGIDRGVVRNDNTHINVVPPLSAAGLYAGFDSIAVGATVPALTFSMYVQISDATWSLVFNPDTQVCDTRINAPGTTKATITRTSLASWEVDLPEGSIGRLYRGFNQRNMTDNGLYYFSARLLIKNE